MAKPRKKALPVAAPAALESPGRWIGRHSLALSIALIAIASLRIASTYTVFNHTCDEPSHIACGMEYLQKGVYRYEPQHPPLARLAAAIGPYLAGRRIIDKGIGASGKLETPDMAQQGAIILYADGQYDRNLLLARLGILPFFWLASLVVFFAARRLGDAVAVTAVFLFTFLPPVLAHAGLATTDMALTAFAGAAFLAGLRWIETPDPRRTLLFGVATGLAVLSKFSCLLFLPAAFAAALVWRFATARPRPAEIAAFARRRALPFLCAVLTGALVIWAGYRFSFGQVDFAKLRLPAPELFAGVRQVMAHNAEGHTAYLLGMHSRFGWWYYYPVVLAVKTPLPFLALLFAGAAMAFRKANRETAALWLPLAFSLGILGSALFSHINIGVRHILPVYLGFSIVAAFAAVRLFESARRQRWLAWALAALLIWHGGTSALSHPDYIPYMNALAGGEPEKILVDSDLDWGQDMKRLAQRLRELGARQVTFNPLIIAYLEAVHGFPPIQPMNPEFPSAGWNAASLTVLYADRLGLGPDHPEVKLWTDGVKPTERVGKTTYLWYVPPQRQAAAQP